MNDARARLFVALELPGEVRSALADWRSSALQGRSGLRLVAPEALHVTLCFLGWQAAGEIGAIASACGPVTACGTVGLNVGSAVWLPPRRPRVLAMSLEDPARGVAEVQSVLSGSLQEGGWYVPESRPFLPHVTVARVAKGARPAGEELAPAPPLQFRASTVTLFRSRLGAAGARYEPLRRFKLHVDGLSP